MSPAPLAGPIRKTSTQMPCQSPKPVEVLGFAPPWGFVMAPVLAGIAGQMLPSGRLDRGRHPSAPAHSLRSRPRAPGHCRCINLPNFGCRLRLGRCTSVPTHLNGTLLHLIEGVPSSIHFFEDVSGGGGPGEGFGVLVVLGEIVVDGRLQFGDALEDAPADGVLGDFGEEAFDLVQPGGRRRREVEMEAGVLFQPRLDLGMLVGGVVVDDQVDVEPLRRLAVEPAQETEELLVPVPLHALADDRAVEHVERREQRRRAVALVIVGHGAGAALLYRQAGLGAVESLNLALLVDRKNQRLVRRVQVKPDNVLHLLGEPRVVRDLEDGNQMRLQSILGPDPLHTG